MTAKHAIEILRDTDYTSRISQKERKQIVELIYRLQAEPERVRKFHEGVEVGLCEDHFAVIKSQEQEIGQLRLAVQLQDEQIATKDKLLDIYRTNGGLKP